MSKEARRNRFLKRKILFALAISLNRLLSTVDWCGWLLLKKITFIDEERTRRNPKYFTITTATSRTTRDDNIDRNGTQCQSWRTMLVVKHWSM